MPNESPAPPMIWHLVTAEKPWIFRPRRRSPRIGQGSKRVELIAGVSLEGREHRCRLDSLCSKLEGVAKPPAWVSSTSQGHGFTRNLKKTNCTACRVAFDEACASGSVEVDEQGRLSGGRGRSAAEFLRELRRPRPFLANWSESQEAYLSLYEEGMRLLGRRLLHEERVELDAAVQVLAEKAGILEGRE